MLRIRIQDFGFLDPDPQKYADPRIRIQEVKYQPKTTKNYFFTPETQIWAFEKKRDYKNVSFFLNGSSSFRIKISEKIYNKFENYFLLKNFSKSWRNDQDPDPFFFNADPGSGSASNLNGSLALVLGRLYSFILCGCRVI